jgi:hypothetical protein
MSALSGAASGRPVRRPRPQGPAAGDMGVPQNKSPKLRKLTLKVSWKARPVASVKRSS